VDMAVFRKERLWISRERNNFHVEPRIPNITSSNLEFNVVKDFHSQWVRGLRMMMCRTGFIVSFIDAH
jgi:hypothetical protein